MGNQYLELKAAHQKEVNEFPMVFAFGKQQFKEAMEQLGLTENDTDKIFSIGGGGFIRKTDSEAFDVLFTKIDKQIQEQIDNDPNGEGFIYDMFHYELNNHEYCYTWDISSTLDALDLTLEQVNACPKLTHGLNKAKKAIRDWALVNS